MLGLRYGTVRLEPYNPEWAGSFAEERRRLLEALSGTSCQVEHVGSTAVPGLCAKPILDIAIGMVVGTLIEPIVSALRGIEYQYRGDAGEAGGRIFVREAAEHVRTHHVHVVDLDGAQWEAYLRLRDFLRTSRAARRIYATEKELLADRYPGDRRGYTAAKDTVVQKLLAQAQGART
jgi:GrpB-like predicted nucleotidyltransferase (UPF0157 family)